MTSGGGPNQKENAMDTTNEELLDMRRDDSYRRLETREDK